MSDHRGRMLAKAKARVLQDPNDALMVGLGMIVGMQEVLHTEKIVGPGLRTVHSNELRFDGADWVITIEKKSSK